MPQSGHSTCVPGKAATSSAWQLRQRIDAIMLYGRAVTQPPLPAAAEAVLTFLESVGRRSEAELYLGLFRRLPKQSFAIIAAEAPVVRQALGSLVEQLRFLSDLGLYAPVVLGLFDPDSAARGAERLDQRLPAAGLEPVVHDAGEADLGAALRRELESEKLPLVRFQPGDCDGVAGRFERTGALCRELDSQKLVFLRRQGGIGPHGERRIELPGAHALGAHGGGISVINLRTDYAPLVRSKLLDPGDARLLERIRDLLLSDHTRALVSVTSPLNLLRELFTVRGAGTLVKRGTEVDRYSSYAELDVARLRALLEASFGRRARDDLFEREPLAIYVERGYRAAAILEPSPVAPFLTKFAVEPLARGEGMGRDLWQAMERDHPRVFWRSRPDNPIASWYVGECDGMLRLARWQVFWRGLDPEAIPRAVAEALERPEDFEVSSPER